MNAISTRARRLVDANLGRCPKCMRISFLASLAAWALLVAVNLIDDQSAFTAVATISALAFTVLWIAHLVAYATRAAMGSDKPNDRSVEPTAVLSRRQIIPIFARALGAVALSTALPATAFAQSRLNKCLTCCAEHLQKCGGAGACHVNYENCVANCNSSGTTPSNWSCW